MNTHDFSDEELMAYADGQLDGARAEAIRAACSGNAGVAAQVAMFRVSQRLLRKAFDPVAGEPLPQHLIDAVRDLRDDQRPAAPAAVQRRSRRRRRPSPALAASIMAALAFAGGWLLHGPQRHGGDGLLASAATLPATVTAALDHVASGEIAHVRIGERRVDVLPLASYESSGRYCREFELAATGTPSTGSARGLACNDGGRWHTAAVVTAGTAAAAPADDGYAPASGSSALATLLGDSRPLSGSEERALLQRGWRKP
jgi:hypothetical protein